MLYVCAARFDVTKNLKKFLILRGTKQDLRFMYAQFAGPHIYKNYGVVFNLSLGEFGPSLERILGPPLTRSINIFCPINNNSFPSRAMATPLRVRIYARGRGNIC